MRVNWKPNPKQSGDVFPSDAIYYGCNGLGLYPEHGCQTRSSKLPMHVTFSYLNHLLRGKFVFSVVQTPLHRKSAFLNAVLSVVFGCSNKKVCRVTARGVVARMANPLAFWNWPIVKLPRKSMSKNGYSTWKAECAVTSLGSWTKTGSAVTQPLPAIVWAKLSNPFPESLGNDLWGSAFLSPPIERFSTGWGPWGSVFSHRSVRLICAKLSASLKAREHFAIMPCKSPDYN